MTEPPATSPVTVTGIPFTQIPDEAITDRDLTDFEFRVLCYVYLHAGRLWDCTVDEIAVALAFPLGSDRPDTVTTGEAISRLRQGRWLA